MADEKVISLEKYQLLLEKYLELKDKYRILKRRQDAKLTIAKACYNYLQKLKQLPSINYGKDVISYASIKSFTNQKKEKNDHNNKIRELIIIRIYNNQIPKEYFKISAIWKRIRTEILAYFREIYSSSFLTQERSSNKLILKGGRSFCSQPQIKIIKLNLSLIVKR